jgi:beta-glucosidase
MGSAEPEIDAAVAAAKKADVAVVAVGILEGEGYDRASLDLPGDQEHLINAVSGTGTPTIVVLVDGSAVTMKNWIGGVRGLLEAWYPGEEGGDAVADLLFGDYSPGAKLPVTFPQSVGQVPLYYNTMPTGRGFDYVDMTGKPLFPFGFGLSYTLFTYSDLHITPAQIPPDGKVTVQLRVRNAGSVTGDEVVQLYTHDPVASVTRPLKALRGFKRITLQPGEGVSVEFTLGKEELSFLDANLKTVVEPGTIEVLLGSSSDDIRLKGSIEVTR